MVWIRLFTRLPRIQQAPSKPRTWQSFTRSLKGFPSATALLGLMNRTIEAMKRVQTTWSHDEYERLFSSAEQRVARRRIRRVERNAAAVGVFGVGAARTQASVCRNSASSAWHLGWAWACEAVWHGCAANFNVGRGPVFFGAVARARSRRRRFVSCAQRAGNSGTCGRRICSRRGGWPRSDARFPAVRIFWSLVGA